MDNRRARRLAVLLAATCAFPLAGPTGTPASADDSLKERKEEAAHELEHSTAAVRAAAAALAQADAALPAARADVDRARGELQGAQAVARSAELAVRRARLAQQAAQRRVDQATREVEEGREAVGRLARRSYQGGPLLDMRAAVTGSPQDVLDRVALLQRVFASRNEALRDLSRQRVGLANQTAVARQRAEEVRAALDAAARVEARARAAASRAERAAQRVEDLAAQRRRALASAEAERAADLAAYREVQRAERELARRLAAEAARRRSSGQVGPRQTNARMVWPANGPMTSRYGYRRHPIYGDQRFHAGIDIGAGSGTPVWAGEDGTVVSAGWGNGYGNLITISHGLDGGEELTTSYAHLSSMSVSPGQRVTRGQVVGRVGSTGNSTGPHLHFETRLDGRAVDPLNYTSPP